MRFKPNKKVRGFTLVEVLIVMVIVAILASLAYGQYTNHVLKSRRTEALDLLTKISALQERYFFSNNEYAADIDDLIKIEDADAYYEVSIAVAGEDEAPGYEVTAKPLGSQKNDSDCMEFVIDQAGRRSSKNGEGAASTEICWRN